MGNGKNRLQYRKTKVEINEKMHGRMFFLIWFLLSISHVNEEISLSENLVLFFII